MGRHSSPDDEVEAAVDPAAVLESERAPVTGEITSVTETGRHHFPGGLADLELGPDPLTVHEAVTPTVAPERADSTDTGPVDLTGLAGRRGGPPPAAVALLDPAAEAPATELVDAPPTVPALTDAPQTEEAPPGAPARRSRAGRDLPAAIGVGVALGAVILVTLFLYRPSFLAVIILAVAYGCYELRTAIGTVEARPPLVPLVIGGAAIALTAWRSGVNGLVVSALLTAAALVIWRLGEGAAGYLRDVASSMFVLLYLPVLAGFAVLLARPDDGAARIIVFVATVVCSDTGGYAVGVWLGRHPLAPGVSKGKTWEGSAGSLLACCIAGVLFLTLVFHQPWWTGLVYGAAVMVAATLGDLGESMIKRDLGVKDMGRLLPGHGGLMDRLDSMLPCAAVAYLLLSYFA